MCYFSFAVIDSKGQSIATFSASPKYGRITVAVSPNYTSQHCSNCGAVVQKSLSQRTHICQCGCELDRDHNAALNILNKALNTTGHVGIYASGDLSSTDAGEILCQQDGSQNEESHGFSEPERR